MKEVIKELNLLMERYQIPIYQQKINDYLAYLIHLKYLCDQGKYQYDEVISNDDIILITHDTVRLSRINNHLPINHLLRFIRNVDMKEVVLDFLGILEKPISFHHDQDKLLYVRFYRNFYSYYNKKGNATYVLDSYLKDSFDLFKIFDEVLGIQNQYLESDNIRDYKDYDTVYVFDDVPKYRMTREKIYDDVYQLIRNNKNVVIYTNYSKISNFSNGRIISKYIDKIIIDGVKTVMLFHDYSNQDESGEISIINYDHSKIHDLDQLNEIIHNNRKQKDILVKLSYQDLKENNLRIGFHLYQLEKNNEIRDINKIVDLNTEYLNQLNYINEKVEKEINILLNR